VRDPATEACACRVRLIQVHGIGVAGQVGKETDHFVGDRGCARGFIARLKG